MSDLFFELGDDDIPEGNARPVKMSWLDKLNPEQRLAVETTEGPLLVLSGAGTGKTRVLTTRLTHILLTGKAAPWNILAVTFTNKAAREMRSRVVTQVGPDAEQIWLGTFHALAARMLRRNPELVGLQSNFTILDSDDQLRVLKLVMEGEGIDTKKYPIQGLMNQIQRWKDRGQRPDNAKDVMTTDPAGGSGVTLYRLYQERLVHLNACDFGDLLLHCLTIFQDQAQSNLLEKYQRQFRYIMVDEYQDANVAQYLWLRLLSGGYDNLCCVGDDDQSIYSWRGAEVENILRFERDFPEARVIRLETNYRSTQAILSAASGLISHNAERLGKTLKAGTNIEGGGIKVQVRGLRDGEEEARLVVERIKQEIGSNTSLNQIAILVRASFQSREFEDELLRARIAYRVVGGLRFYERQEIRDAVAYLRIIVQPYDDLAFERIINVPKRGLGDAVLQAIYSEARKNAVSLMSAARGLVSGDGLKSRPRNMLASFLSDLDRWKEMLQECSHDEVAATILEESGYNEMWRNNLLPDAPGRVENLKELIVALGDFSTLQDFLEHISLVMENDEKSDDNKVSIMTLHGAKGLEFDVVFLPGWEEGLFPHQRSLAESGDKGLEEERRLAYVGLTRARRRVMISHAAGRRVYNQWQSQEPSRFIDELPVDLIDRQGNRVRAFAGHIAKIKLQAASLPVRTVASARHNYLVGSRIFHQRFGYGIVTAIDADKLSVLFDNAETKMVLARFVQFA